MGSLELLLRSVTTMAPAGILTLTGALVCYKQWLDSYLATQMLQATTDYMLPLYVLFSLPRIYDTSEVWKLWPLVISPLIVIPFLGLIGLFCSVLVNVPTKLQFSIACVYSFSSIGNIGVLIVKSACAHFGPLYQDPHRELALAYLCTMWLPFNIVMFFLALPLLQRESKNHSQKIWNVITKYLLSPLPIVAVLANVLGIIPGMNWFLFEKDSGGFMLTDCALMIGNTGILFSQMNVGSHIVLDLKDWGHIDKSKIVWIAVSRNIFVSSFVLIYTSFMWNYGLFYGNRVMAFTVFIGLSAPPTFMILIFMKEFEMGIKEVNNIILWVFITSSVTLTLSIYFFFLIIN